MILINKHKYSHVYFKPDFNEFEKFFYPSLSKKIKYILRLRKYPGHNFKFISNELNKLGIATAEITHYSKYAVKTKNIGGTSLDTYVNNNYSHPILDTFIKLVAKIILNNIYFGDFSLKNFIVKNNTIYAIDLEDYRKEIFFTHNKKYCIARLYKSLPKEIADQIKEVLLCTK